MADINQHRMFLLALSRSREAERLGFHSLLARSTCHAHSREAKKGRGMTLIRYAVRWVVEI